MLKCLFVSVATLSLMSVAYQASSNETATVEVSLVIKESCVVRQVDGEQADQTAPSVECALDSPYGVQPGAHRPPHAKAPRSSVPITPSLWQVTF
ncbi:hypothetical protein SAMN05216570_0379 [Dyella sp. OK004]|nr:hypothetical protein SAMN05216570_0379 [Dyella sp. OK004]